MPPIDILDETGRESVLAAESLAAAQAILDGLGRSDAELSIVLVDDERIRVLNRDWRGKDKPTDVLSFPQTGGLPDGALIDDGDEGSGDARSAGDMPGADDRHGVGADAAASVMLGDVVVSVETLRRQAADGGWTESEELARLLLHGVLHLVGFDHEHDDDAREMRAEEDRIVGILAARGIACASDVPV